MILTLQVVGERAQDLGAANRKVFNAIGGTIGRLPDNDWVFADPYISGRHALIRYVNGQYFIEDTSTNGVFINSLDKRVSKGQPQQLNDGDRLYIDAYEIEVSIKADPTKSKRDPFADPHLSRKSGATRFGADHTASLVLDDVDEFDDLDDPEAVNSTQWYGAQEIRSGAPAPRPMLDSVPSTQQAATAPPITRKPATSSSSAPANAASSAESFATLLAAAGIDDLEETAEAAGLLGAMLRSSVGGLMEILRARERMKDELRIRGTTFKPAHNNPLKFSANVDDAFHNLLIKRNAAYLAPPEALEDAFRDVRDHQAAVMMAMRLAFEAMLARFDPELLQGEFDRHLKKGSILGVPAKLKYWDLYRERYAEMAKDADASFRALFAEEFAHAYEEQLARLKARGRD